MAEDLQDLDPAFRASVEAFMAFYLERSVRDFRPFLAEDCTFEGALTAGRLGGRDVVAAHMRRTLQGPFAESALRFCGAVGTGTEVELRWCARSLAAEDARQAEGTSRLEGGADGRIRRIVIVWDPRAYLRKPAKG